MQTERCLKQRVTLCVGDGATGIAIGYQSRLVSSRTGQIMMAFA
jgi:hypothetical protein